MFNEISRQRAMQIIDEHFPHLSNVTSLLLAEPTKCYYILPNGEWKHFNQEEGLLQGFPFSPVFAALILHSIISKIDTSLRDRARKGKAQGILLDDKKGEISQISWHMSMT